MSSTSEMRRSFAAEPIRDKSVTDLVGVGGKLGRRLEAAGFDTACIVLGQYLILKKDLELFKQWMKKTCNANTKQATDCYNCLNDWCELFL